MRHQPARLLVTGGAGFIGSNFVHWMLARRPDVRIVTLDALTYAGSLSNLEGLPDASRHVFVHGDIRDAALVDGLLGEHRIDTVVHFAAESHVDRSIEGPGAFVQTNVLGTFTLLEACRRAWLGPSRPGRTVRFHHVSTDEVYGSLGPDDPAFTEETSYAPNSPYSASKAASDHLVRAYRHTYGLPVTLSNCSNNYGPRQHGEKFIPTVMRACLEGRPIPVYGNGRNVRDWLYVDDHCEAIDRIVREAEDGETFNVGGLCELQNIELARRICRELDARRPGGAPHERLLTFVTDRAGHDWRYAIDISRLQDRLGWRPVSGFASGIAATVDDFLGRWSADERHGR
ncbi:MAG: dTDP-glucose 4,6-dehydratase [Pseudomonadota bacterium]